MTKRILWIGAVISSVFWGSNFLFGKFGVTLALAWQAPTSTPPEIRVEAFQDVNVRAGPGTEYDQVGVMVRGQSGAILGRTPNSFWLKIEYIGGPDNTGWVYKDLVRVIGDVPSLPTIIPPPTPTLPPTPTSEVTLEGSAIPEQGSLPTFTAPPAVARPTLLPIQGARQGGGFPPALFIISLFVLGMFGGVVSLMRQRN